MIPKKRQHTVSSLENGFIGLDFAEYRGDLELEDKEKLNTQTNDIRGFVHEVKSDDWVCIFVHNKPFALVTEIGEYNYIKNRVEELNIWFRHFRKAGNVYYYADASLEIRNNPGPFVMTNTFSKVSFDSKTGTLIADWVSEL